MIVKEEENGTIQSISDILINHSSKSTHLLKYLKELIRCKNEFLSKNKVNIFDYDHVCAVSLFSLRNICYGLILNVIFLSTSPKNL